MTAQPYGPEFQLGEHEGEWHQGLGLRFELSDREIAEQAASAFQT